jgi:hypothetical protein
MLMGVQYGQMKDGFLRVLQVATVIFDGLPRYACAPSGRGRRIVAQRYLMGAGEGPGAF